jgi:hypothetical protein
MSYSSSQGNQAKTRSYRRWQGTYTFLPIITNRELVDAHLATYETRLVYLQKIIEHNEPFMPALMKASTYIAAHYRNGTHAFNATWTASNLRYTPFWMKQILASHIHNAERPHMTKRGETQTWRGFPLEYVPSIPHISFLWYHHICTMWKPQIGHATFVTGP